MPQLVITEYMDDAAVADLKQSFDLVYDPQLVDDRPRLISLLADAEGLVVRNRTQVTAELLDHAPHLKVVGRLGVGLDNIDLVAAAARDIAVCPAEGANADSVAEYVITSALLLLRPVYHARAAMMAGEFPRPQLSHGQEIRNKTMTLIGGGVIGLATMRRAEALGMSVVIVDPQLELGLTIDGAEVVTMDDGLRQGDVISLHVPLNDKTRDLIDAKALDRMKSSVILINTARGGVVDHNALADALRSGKIAGAALDVFPNEPASADDLAMFDGLDNIILTPHVAGLTQEANSRVGTITAHNIRRYLEPSS